MDDVIGIILLIVTIIVSLPVVGMMMLLFAIFIEDKKENLKNMGKEDWKNEEREAYKK